tara:strand:+ start:170 stop:493 length:324 start_codon:yes stop_codon:yes gene_type:complete
MKKEKNYSEVELDILRKIEKNPKLTQRQISKQLGISLGKTNYLIKALLSKGLLMIENFKTSKNKLRYLYVLTPKGLEVRKNLTILFLKRKSEEFDKLKEEIEKIKKL